MPLNVWFLRVCVLWVALAFTARPLHAQLQQKRGAAPEPAAESIERQLRANDPKAVAWGAYLAGERRLRGAVPSLVDALASPRLQQSGIEWASARNAVLDALIQLAAHPRVDVLVPYYSEHREPVLILLSAPRPGRDPVLLKLLKQESGIPWYAIAGLLLEGKARGLAAELIRGLRLTLDVTVIDGSPHEGPSFEMSSGVGIGDGVLYLAPGFPSIATYSLWNRAVRGAIVLAEGPHPIYYMRSTSPPDTIPSGPSNLTIEGPGAVDRLKFLEKLLEHWLPVSAVEEITLNWTTARRLQADVGDRRERIGQQYRQMLRLARRANLLTADEANGLVPAIDVQVRDRRRNSMTPLPDVSRTVRSVAAGRNADRTWRPC